MPINLDPTKPRSWSALKAYWRHIRGACGRCGKAIDYDGTRYVWVTIGNRLVRKENPLALDVGHILGRDIDHRKEWAPIDTRPEHAVCNRSAGAAYGNRKRGALRRIRRQAVITSREW